MRSTQILHPLENVSEGDVKVLKDLWKQIKKELNDLKEGPDITFDKLLETFAYLKKSTYKQYVHHLIAQLCF